MITRQRTSETIGLAEAARHLGIPYRTISQLVLAGVLKGQKRRGRWWVLKTSVADLAHAKYGGLPGHFAFGPASGRPRLVQRNRRARPVERDGARADLRLVPG